MQVFHTSLVITTNTSVYLCKIRVFLDLSLLFIYLAYGIHTRWVITIKKKINFSGYISKFQAFYRLLGFPVFSRVMAILEKQFLYFSSCLLKPLALLRTSDFKLLLFSTSVKHWKTAFQDCARWSRRYLYYSCLPDSILLIYLLF